MSGAGYLCLTFISRSSLRHDPYSGSSHLLSTGTEERPRVIGCRGTKVGNVLSIQSLADLRSRFSCLPSLSEGLWWRNLRQLWFRKVYPVMRVIPWTFGVPKTDDV